MIEGAHCPSLAELANIESERVFTAKSHAELLADLLALQRQMLSRRRLLSHELQLVEERIDDLIYQLNTLRGALS